MKREDISGTGEQANTAVGAVVHNCLIGEKAGEREREREYEVQV